MNFEVEEMKKMNNIKKLVIAALMAALTAVATMAIQIPSPLHGYVHLGDSLVLLCGIVLGPLGGALAAGIGSMMADLLTGYFIYAPATLVIKGLAAFAAGLVFSGLAKSAKVQVNRYAAVVISGISSAVIVILGYFVYEIFLYGVPAAAANTIFNAVQGIFGIIGAFVLFPLLSKVPDIRDMLNMPHITPKKSAN